MTENNKDKHLFLALTLCIPKVANLTTVPNNTGRYIYPYIILAVFCQNVVAYLYVIYKLMPYKSLILKTEKCHGGKLCKERSTVLIYTNTTGTHMRKPLVIGTC